MTGRALFGRRTRSVPGSRERAGHSWIELLAVSGPFLTVPVLQRVFPQGMPPVPAVVRAKVRQQCEVMMGEDGVGRDALIATMLTEVCDWADRASSDLPDALAALVPEHGQIVRPDFAFWVPETNPAAPDTDASATRDDDDDDNGDTEDVEIAEEQGPYRLLGMVVPWRTHPLTRTTHGGWTASTAERLAVLLRARNVPIGLVTDGRWWALVWAPSGGATGIAVWDADQFSAEPDSLAAFAALFGRARFLGVDRSDTLPALLAESAQRQEEITQTLGQQVRDAVELLLRTVDQADADTDGQLLLGVGDDDLYAGVITVMMRIVFLLFAEERRLLPSDDLVYASAYSVGGLVDELEGRAAVSGESSLSHRTTAWHRLLAVARAVHAGVHHEDLRMPAYGSGLFDPERHPWLEGRRPGQVAPDAAPPAIDDLTVLKMLRAVQYVTIAGHRRRLTFRALGVEQIGYVYEGLLEMEVRTATELTLHLERPKTWPRGKAPCEVPVSVVIRWNNTVPPTLLEQVRARTGWTASRVEATLRDILDDRILMVVLGPDREALLPTLRSISAVLARDDLERPMVTLPHRRFLAASTRRASTGTHYTPPQLAAEVVVGALEPLVYWPGPLQTAARSTWQPRPSQDILRLRIADIAMGSGAFLVAACRYLADCLVQARQLEGDPAALAHQTSGAGRLGGSTVDAEVPPVLLRARREVAEHCLYGVDVNPLAVEMAKLSLWLFTMDRQRPFGFLDDRLVSGDSVLGLTSVEQLEELHIDPAAGRRISTGGLDYTQGWRDGLRAATVLRKRITARPVEEIRDVEFKQGLLADSDSATGTVHIVADFLTGVGLRAASIKGIKARDNAFIAAGIAVGIAQHGDDSGLRADAARDLQAGRPAGTAARVPLHWPVRFPEIFTDTRDPGFDAIIGNPPFLGGKKISGALGDDYLAWLQLWDGNGLKGSTDLAARFVLRAQKLMNAQGQLGYIATNTLVEGDTLEVGLAQAVARGMTIRAGKTSHKWPSASANLEIVDVWGSEARVANEGLRELDGEWVPSIGADLEPVGRVTGPKHRLAENEDIAFQGSVVLGLGFTLTIEQARDFITDTPRNVEVLLPYIIGRDLNQRPDCSASRWIVNFRDWSLERASGYPEILNILQRLVEPQRARKDYAKYPRMIDEWWMHWRARPELYEAIAHLDHVLAISLHGSAVLPVRLKTGAVFSHACAVFALEDFASLAMLSSNIHATWVIRYTSTLETRIRYSLSDVFLTLPRPEPTALLNHLGERLDKERRVLMLSRGWGLTTTYNYIHNPAVGAGRDPEIAALRELHRDIDLAVLDAYGWSDLDPEIGHHPTKLGTRWTFSPTARFELLDRLLEQNQRRFAQEAQA